MIGIILITYFFRFAWICNRDALNKFKKNKKPEELGICCLQCTGKEAISVQCHAL